MGGHVLKPKQFDRLETRGGEGKEGVSSIGN